MLTHVERLTDAMDRHRVDAVVGSTFENVRYLSGIASLTLDLVPHAGLCFAVATRDRPRRPCLVATRGDMDQFLDGSVDPADVVGFGDFFRENARATGLTGAEELLRRAVHQGPHPGTAAEALVHALRRAGVAEARIAVDERPWTRALLDEVRAALPRAELVPGSELLRWVRKVKTPAEVDRLARAAAVAEEGVLAATALAASGTTERDLVRAFECAVVAAGGRPRFTLIRFGSGAVAGQVAPGSAPLRPGHAVWMDVGCQVEGYWADIARVFCLGEPPEGLERRHAAVLAGQRRAIADCRPGMTGRELFALTVEAVREAGLPHYRRQNVGHGIGLDLYDHVLLAPGSDEPIEEGTVVNVETPYHEFGFGAVQVEDPFVARAAGNHLLTSLPGELGVLPLPG